MERYNARMARLVVNGEPLFRDEDCFVPRLADSGDALIRRNGEMIRFPSSRRLDHVSLRSSRPDFDELPLQVTYSKSDLRFIIALCALCTALVSLAPALMNLLA